MPGGPPSPSRPARKRSRNPDCAFFRSPGIWGWFFILPFGLIFTLTGTLALYVAVRSIPMVVESYSDWRFWIGIFGITIIGVGHAACGLAILHSVFFGPEWLTIARQQGVARKQSGVLCFRRKATAMLKDFTEVSIFPMVEKWFERDSFEVALTGPQDKRFPIGRVTLSYDLAREFGKEVATFLGLPIKELRYAQSYRGQSNANQVSA